MDDWMKRRKVQLKLHDPINPPYYKRGIEVADFLDAYDLDRWEAQVVKYVVRARSKGGLEDYKKARWYLGRVIKRAEVQGVQGVVDTGKTRGVPATSRKRGRKSKKA